MVTAKPPVPLLDTSDPIALSLVTAHPLVDGIGSTISDISGNGYNGTATGTFTWFNDPTLGVVLELDGASAFINLDATINSIINVQSTSTVAFWIKLRTATPVVATKTGLIDLQAFAGANSATKYPDTDGLGYFSTFRQISRFNGVNLGATNRAAWHHLAITTVSSGTYRVYINGAEVSNTTAELGVHATIPPTLGRSTDTSGGPYYLDGWLGDFRLWSRELLAPEILTLFNDPWAMYQLPVLPDIQFDLIRAAVDVRPEPDTAVKNLLTSVDLRDKPDMSINSLMTAIDVAPGADTAGEFVGVQVDVKPTPQSSFPPLADEIDPRRKPDTPVKFPTQFDTGMVVAIPFAEGTGTTAADYAGSTGGPHSATLVGAATWSAGGFRANDYSTALALNPNGSYAEITRNLEHEPSTLITIAAWVTPTSGSQTSRAIVAKLGTAGFSYYLGTETDQWRFQVQDNIDGVATLNAIGTFTSSTLYHLVATYDGVNLRLYINGVQNNTLGNSGTIVYDITKNVRIGQGEGGTSFVGRIDDVRIWNGRVLDATEISDLYLSQFAMYCNEAMIDSFRACADVRPYPDAAMTAMLTTIDLRDKPDMSFNSLLTAIDLAPLADTMAEFLGAQIDIRPPISNPEGLTILSVYPNVGTKDGGTFVTINGINLLNITDVQIGGVSLTGLSSPDTSTVTGTTGAHVPGLADVTVFSATLGNVTLTDGFAYVPFFGTGSENLLKGAQLDPSLLRTEYFTGETAPLAANTTLSFVIADYPIDKTTLELYVRRVGENGGTLQRQGLIHQYDVDLPNRQIIWRDTATFALIATDEIIVRYLAQGAI